MARRLRLWLWLLRRRGGGTRVAEEPTEPLITDEASCGKDLVSLSRLYFVGHKQNEHTGRRAAMGDATVVAGAKVDAHRLRVVKRGLE